MEDFLTQELINRNGYILLMGDVIASAMTILMAVYFTYFVRNYLGRILHRRTNDSEENITRVKRITTYAVVLLVIIILLKTFHIDRVIHPLSNDNITLRISTIFQALLILQIARLFDWAISQFFINNYYARRDEAPRNPTQAPKPEGKDTANRTVQWAVYIFAVVMILRAFQIDFTIWDYPYTIDGVRTDVPFKVSNILVSIIIVLGARIAVWLITQLVLYRYYQYNDVNIGTQFAINQLLKYVVYVIAIIIAVENLGFQMTIIWGGLAALLVGIGLGLQSTFNDFFSGIILLFERSVEVGDILEVDGMVGTVNKIGMRASLLETRDNMSVIVPNSHLVTQNVTNWSHFDDKMRFHISVGVAYGSDTSLIKKILLEVAHANPHVIDFPKSFVRFVAFGESSLDFELHFWSKTFLTIEDIKSDIRLAIDQKFREHQVEIPFPQRDLWFRSSPSSKTAE